jgi:hypothetical protein
LLHEVSCFLLLLFTISVSRTPHIRNGISKGGARNYITGKEKRVYTRTLETGTKETVPKELEERVEGMTPQRLPWKPQNNPTGRHDLARKS